MRYEIRKILKNVYVVLFLLLLVVCNSVLFYQQCTDDSQGYTMQQLQGKYASWETLEQETNALISQMDATVAAGDFTFLDSNLNAYRLNQAALERVAQAQSYGEHRVELIRQAELLQSLGLMGTPNSFANRNLAHGAQQYRMLAGTRPEVCFTGGIELLTSWHISDIFVLLFGITGSMMLLTMEKTDGYLSLLRTTRHGRGRLYLRKYGAMVLLVSVGFILLHGIELLTVSVLFGLKNLSAPIQSIFGYNSSPLAISMGEYLTWLFGMKYLWALSCSGIIFAICSFTDSHTAAMGTTAAGLVLAVLLFQTDSLWLRALSVGNVAQYERLFQEAVYLNLFGQPLDRISFTVFFLLLLLLSFFAVGMTAFCRTPKGGAKRKMPAIPLPSLGSHTNLLLHEGYKIFVLQGGILILVVFLTVQVLTYQSFHVDNSEFELYYRHYSSILEGLPTEEKTQYLESETLRFQQIEEQIQKLQEIYTDPTAFAMAAGDLTDQLRPKEAFETAKQQYEMLREGQSYLYATPYLRLFGEEGQQEDLTNLAKGIFALVLALSGVFAVEQETGVAVLQATAGKTKAVALRKMLHICVFALFVWAITFVPMCVCIFREIGAFAFEAQANSTQVLASLSNFWTVGGIFAVSLFVKLLLTELAALVIFSVSQKTGNTIVTMLLCLPIVLIPLGSMALI